MKVSNTELLKMPTTLIPSSVKTQMPKSLNQSSPLEPNIVIKTINMRSISLNEINELIKSGVNGLLAIVPAVSSQITNPYSSEYAADTKVDFIGQIEASIEFQKSIGENVDFLNNVLAHIKSLDGTNVPVKINTIV